MGWNSYNSYSCSPTEQKIKTSAQGLIDLGLAGLGYNFVTVDCGWLQRGRDSQGRLQWNATNFPSGGKGLGDYLHGKGLGFGLYSGAGYFQCGSTDLPASLGFEKIDAQSFAEWGGDSLKYDNCYSTSNTTMVDGDSAEAQSPARFQRMATELDAVDRDIRYYICQWGIGTNLGKWASAIGNTWRISNDIYNAWRSIWRITNEAVRYYKHTTVGAFADMDMLIVGLNALSEQEERFHFSMWAISKSPLIIGAILDSTRLSQSSLNILSNKEIIAINQDPLAKQAQLTRRYTEEEYDIWLGDLSGSRKVLGISNWRNNSQSMTIDLSSLGIASANVRDVWAARDMGARSGVQKVDLAGHEMKIWVLSNIVASSPPRSSGYYSAANATLAGPAHLVSCAGGQCLPTQRKVGDIFPGASVSIRNVTSKRVGKKLVGVDYINFEYAFDTAWDWGTNTRNMTISVNGNAAKRWAFPVSGGDWFETGRLMIEVDGFVAGSGNEVVFRAAAGDVAAPDLVGFEIFE
ncbi:carbohydrate-binding module family 35 protein [Melanomma pulvis-pyrius CBS 109.77]|uniref:Alpha-galactosidase n=1 Tax=Melanomma pulvis-pyrius CBS 109.77 TaxID=1314802 RepID=A0A6A6X7M9_9PLEO|nr:carbohydrate-binding module family 35 protein [Melanomma pulvis-pyrius CBS 109.77]